MRRLLVSVLGAVVVVAMVIGVWRYVAGDRNETELRILEVHGAVTLDDGVDPRLASSGEALQADDHLATAEASRVVLGLNGGTRIRIKPSSSVRVKSVDLDGVDLELEDGALTATVRPESGAVRVGNGDREVVAVRGEFAMGVSGDVLQVDAREGDLVLSGVDITRVEEGQQATVVDRHAEIADVPAELLLDVTWPRAERTRSETSRVEGHTVPGARVVARGRFGTRTTRAGRDGRFALDVPLEEGDNDVQLTAFDPVGRSAEVKGQLQTRDTRAPILRGGVEYGP